MIVLSIVHLLKQDARLVRIRQWLSAPDPSTNYHKALKKRQADTGLWFLFGAEFTKWKTAVPSSLWLHGIPGCGKTILSSTVIENVLQHCDNDPGKVVAYFYFDFNDAQKQDPELMLRSIICQLSQQCVEIPADLDALFEACGKGLRQPSSDAISKVTAQIIQEFPQVYIVLDSLDECTQRAVLMEILESLAALENIHLLVTSRRERDIESGLEDIVSKENRICVQSSLVDMDISRYVRQQLADDKSLTKWQKDYTVMEEIQAALRNGAHGMYGYSPAASYTSC